MLKTALVLLGALAFLFVIYLICHCSGLADERQNYLYSSYWREQAKKKKHKRKHKKK